MKLLIVFVSALVLVAHGKAAPSNDEERVNQIQVEPVAEYAAEEAGEPQAELFEVVPAVDEPVDVGAGPQRGSELEELAELHPYAPETIYLPIISKACTNSSCLYICNLLGFAKGTCISASTCQCYN
ncbi:hypothetical protein PYW08_015216 [Mythimna loreyi]|uniref:Uncharacterized protein n=1 Tax=Mythimna loreyi TaxID=667449 RepID=A0ACC2QV08_9NEOP|nr:hypothetical protein PYW08_015216 [Mythimna loreyi]